MLTPTVDRDATGSDVAVGKALNIVYTNYRGETSIRRIVPERIWFGATDWHPEEQWLLEAVDLDKHAARSFALKDIRTCFG